jgi:Domain of unknown function (DUF4413)
MLDRALLYRSVFERLSVVDRNYTFLPSADEWCKVEEIRNILKPFNSITNLFSGSDYPTSNFYFENVWNIQMRLSKLVKSSDPGLRQMGVGMMEKFDKYWAEYNHALSFGAILDPRKKLSFVSARYKKLKEDAKTVVLKEQFQQMFNEYAPRIPGVNIQVRSEDPTGSDINNQVRIEDVGSRGIEVGEDNLSVIPLNLYNCIQIINN